MPQFKNTKLDQTNKPQKVADLPKSQPNMIDQKNQPMVPNLPGQPVRQNLKPSEMSNEEISTWPQRNLFFNRKDKDADIIHVDGEEEKKEDSKKETSREEYLEKF